MGNLEDRNRIHQESLSRLRNLSFGEAVTNICAGNKNPHRYGYFVELKKQSHKNRYGIIHTTYFARCTNKKGKFWDASIRVTYPGHLSDEECRRLFEPIWQAEHGS